MHSARSASYHIHAFTEYSVVNTYHHLFLASFCGVGPFADFAIQGEREEREMWNRP